ncbi:mersacidin/lichenicidin family type 2 lantibiotic [Kitasatospora sp. NPDC008050]|uniref:mersacidin/lichenicidin family type 2 lantibiotic n=1 Tax=Kitasatospora sp. NPDC008050 TaxID=3364021 RepID=UPI0036E66B25
MNVEELVRYWKDPEARTGAAHAHPAGEITLEEHSRSGRRAALLAGLDASATGGRGNGYTLVPIGTSVSSP